MRTRWLVDKDLEQPVQGSDERDLVLPAGAELLLLPALAALFWGLAYGLRNAFWATVGIVVGLVAAAFFVSSAATGIKRFLLRRRRRDFLLARTRPPFSLFLRSSTADLNLSPDAVYPNSWVPVSISDSYGEHVPLRFRCRQFLEIRLAPLTILAIKNHEKLDTFVAQSYADHTWRDEILLDFRQSHFILILPLWPSAGLLWEVQTLKSLHLMHKVLFVLPPTFRGQGRSWPARKIGRHIEVCSDSTLAPDRLRTDWNRSVEILKAHGVTLPRYPEADDRFNSDSVDRFNWDRGALLAQSTQANAEFDLLLPWDQLTLKWAEHLAQERPRAPVRSQI